MGSHVVILLGLFNGAQTLRDQLESIASQTHTDWSLIVSDDGSIDDGLELVESFRAEHPSREIEILRGPGNGFQANYLSLLQKVDARAEFVAFSDQDDVWLPKKLEVAIGALSRHPAGDPVAYGGRTLYCDQALQPLRPSPLFRREPSFQNALVQSVAGANTFVLNNAATALLKSAHLPDTGIVSHDWWAYQLVTGVGGRVIYDPEPMVLYRQHEGNLVGANDTVSAAATRIGQIWQGRFRQWSDINIAALRANAALLSEENRCVLSCFEAMHSGGGAERLRALAASGIHRQSVFQTIALWFFTLMKRV